MIGRRFVAAAWLLMAGLSSARAEVAIEKPWARASVGPNAAIYLTLSSRDGDSDRLVAATSPAAARTELHTTERVGDAMRMRAVDGIDVPAGQTAALQPGGLHIMLMGLSAPLREGDRVPLSLTFAKGGRVSLEVPVVPAGAMSPASPHDPSHAPHP